MYRKQKNITLTAEQQAFVAGNYQVLTYLQMAKILGVSMGKIMSNMRLMGLKKSCRKSEAKRRDWVTRSNSFDLNGFFDTDKWLKINRI